MMLLMMALLAVQAVSLAMPTHAMAQATPPAPTTPTTPTTPAASPTTERPCTDFEANRERAFNRPATEENPGLLTSIYQYIKDIVGDSTRRLYESFINNGAYISAVYGAITLMIIIFGVGFIIGVIQPSYSQVLVRLIKLGIIMALISPSGWNFFSSYMVSFFNDTTDQLLRGVTAIGTGVTPPAGSSPFYQFDALAAFLIQPDTIVAILGATFSGGPYGLMMGGLMIFAFAGFLMLLIKALQIYAVSFVARSLLLGLAPIFFVFLLFEKTKQLFMNWINALVSLSLQPILLFTFLSFFMILLESASTDMLNTDFCWSEYRTREGTTNQQAFWRAAPNGQAITGQMDWQGTFDCIAKGEGTCPEFPMNIIDMLTFIILVYIAKRFAEVIEKIANELSNAYISLDTGGRFEQFMSSRGSGVGESIGRAAPRNPSAMTPQNQTPPMGGTQRPGGAG